MSKWLWCGAATIVLSAGAAICVIYWQRHHAGSPIAVTTLFEPRPEVETAPPVPPLPQLPPMIEDVHEPILTRPERLESTSENVAALATTGGAEECDAADMQSPRPDRETRRMPYADDHEFRDMLTQVFNWRRAQAAAPAAVPGASAGWWDLAMRALQLRSADEGSAEESAEPPLLELPVPSHYHPPHCPYHGHCPYPYRAPQR